MHLLLTVAGVAILLFCAAEVYVTILLGRGRAGYLSEALNRGIWRLSRFLVRGLPRGRQHRWLSKVGPLLLPLLIAALLLLLTTGYALIYLPHLPESFHFDPPQDGAPLLEALYFSGSTLLTLGYGDVVPRTVGIRFLALAEATSGFALISLAVTYLVTVYGALGRKRAVSLAFFHEAEQGADAAGSVLNHFVDGRFHGLAEGLNKAAHDLHELLEAHLEHPVIHYFHPIEAHTSLARILFLTLETSAILRSCVEARLRDNSAWQPPLAFLQSSAFHVLDALVFALRLEVEQPGSESVVAERERRWRRRFAQTMGRLRTRGIATVTDQEEGWRDYRRKRADWEAKLRPFANYLGYTWEEIAGDGDLANAAREERELESE